MPMQNGILRCKTKLLAMQKKNCWQCKTKLLAMENKIVGNANSGSHLMTRLCSGSTATIKTLVRIYLTIRSRAQDFYEVIDDEGETRINYHFIEIESE